MRRAVPLTAALAALAACSGPSPARPAPQPSATQVPDAAASTIARLGAVPIPTPPTLASVPVASAGRPQLLAIGEPVLVRLPRIRAVLTALGPDVHLPSPAPDARPPASAPGDLTLRASVDSGSLSLHVAELSSRDQAGRALPLHPVGPAAATARAGHPATLRVGTVFSVGAAQVTWRHGGHVIAVWDFNVELD